jgi:hypothetical protein
LEETEPISTLKNLNCRKNTFQKLPNFSKGNHVLDASASNTNGFFLGTHMFLNTAEYADLEEREPISTREKLHCRKYSFQKLTQFPQGTI